MQTNVDVKTNSEAKKNAGLSFARSVIFPAEKGGIPLSAMIPKNRISHGQILLIKISRILK